MRVKNDELEFITDILYNLSLKGRESRMRTRLVRILRESLEFFHEDRLQLLREYGELDANGDFIFADEEKTEVSIKKGSEKEFQEQFLILLEEETIIEKSEANRDMLISVGQSLLSADMEFSQVHAEVYDKWCEMFEDVIEEYQKEESQKYSDGGDGE